MNGEPEIPERPSPLEARYMALGAKDIPGPSGQLRHLTDADETTGSDLAAELVASVEHYADYGNPQPFYDGRRAFEQHNIEDGLTTSSIASWLQHVDVSLRNDSGVPLGLTYVDREIVPLRTKGQGREMSARSRRCRRLDLLMRADDGSPVIAEIKAKSDQHPYYALVQALVHVSQLASGDQRDRLMSAYPESKLRERGTVDVALVFAENWHRFFEPKAGWSPRSRPRYTPVLAERALVLSRELIADPRVRELLGRIVWLSATTVDGRLVFEERYVFEADGSR